MDSRALIAGMALAGFAASCAAPRSAPSGDGTLSLTSPSFESGEAIPPEHATGPAGGSNISPPLAWEGAPGGTRSFALEVVDMHPVAHHFVHWLVVDIASGNARLTRGASRTAMPPGSKELNATSGRVGWSGPQPPIGSGAHTYRFTLYALDTPSLDVGVDASLEEFRASVESHVLASAVLEGTFER